MRPHPREARQRVLELRQLDLHFRFGRASADGENVEDQLRAIDNALADRVLDVFGLRWREFVVEDDQRSLRFLHALAELLDLSGSEVRGRVPLVELLGELSDDDRSRCVGEPLELLEMLSQISARVPTLERRSDEERTLDWLLDCNRLFGDLSL